MTIATLTAFFGWMTVLNLAFLTLTTIILLMGRDTFASLHAGMFQLDKTDVKRAYFRYLANYKVLTFIFCLVPYIALRLL